MTRFVGEAVGHRKGTGNSNTGKSRQKKLEKFLETGTHDDIERAKLLNENSRIPLLPDFDPNRSFVFMDISIANKHVGRLTIELFDDIIPMGTAHLRNRCLPGSRVGLAGASVHKLVPHYAAFLGRNPQASEGMTLRPVNSLRALEPGTVSLSMTGDEVAISLAKALTLDTTGYQVVGRVHRGKEVLDLINDVVPAPDSSPFHRIAVTKCGATNARGDHEDLEQAGPVSKADAIAKLKEQSASARSAVLEALEVGLGQAAGAGTKRKAPEDEGPGTSAAGAGPSGQQGAEQQQGQQGAGQGQGPSSKQHKAAPAGGAAKAGGGKSKALDALLGGGSDSDSDSGDDS